MSTDNWRMKLHTFSDESKLVYTVTNVPPIIPQFASSIDSETLRNSSLGSLRRPHLNIGCYPELPFLLRSLPVGDPLLSRVCVDPEALMLAHSGGRWALAEDIRNAWTRLETGLLYVSEMLMTSTEQSSCGTSGRYAIAGQAHWSHPEDSGYRNLHPTPQSARVAIRCAHVAFQILIARCSLAIALWLFPSPQNGHVPHVMTTHYDSQTDRVAPDWVQFLTKKGVPLSWIDALSDSVISDFSFNLRVGAVLDASDRVVLPIAPVLRAANLPVFILWRSPEDVKSCGQELPFMKPFAPPTPADFFVAWEHPPTGKPRIVTLFRHGLCQPCPDFASVDQLTPPFGPYQLPGESRLDFFARRARFRTDQERQESKSEMEWRQQRMALAETGLPPSRRCRTYLWVNAQLLFPELPPQWYGQEYRYPITPGAYRSIWMVHPAGYRQYNAFFDEWDLWFPPDWGICQPEDLSEPLSPEIQCYAGPHSPPIDHPRTSAGLRVNNDEVHRLLAIDTSLMVAGSDDEDSEVAFPSNYLLGHWYGITITDSRTFPEVDYTTWTSRLPQIFSELAANIPNDADQQSLFGGWVWAMLAGDMKSRALMHTWDLDARNAAFLLRDAEVRSCISFAHVRASSDVEETDDVIRWVLVKFTDNPDNLRWSILTTAMGALWLARQLAEADTSRNAAISLVSLGIPFRTAIQRSIPAAPDRALPLPSGRRMLAPWRPRGQRPTLHDYQLYCQRVLELAARPHSRAAWLKVGIVWRIMRQVTGRERPLAIESDVPDGPSPNIAHHQLVATEKSGDVLFDDGLSPDELNIIAGVVRVYTGIQGQTEDASWWPKHAAWVKEGAYTGIWTPWQEHWFQERLDGILAGREGPLNATQWKDKIKGFKKAGYLAARVEQASWDFTLQYFDEGAAR